MSGPTIQPTALYRFYDAEGNLLYVGVTGNPASRFSDHRRTSSWWAQADRHEVEWLPHWNAALKAERRAIQEEMPRWNSVFNTKRVAGSPDMGQQIIKQPDGRLAVFSSVVDAFVVVDATPEEILDWRAEQAAEDARRATQRELDAVLADDPRRVYFQFARSWEEASEMDRQNAPEEERPVGSEERTP
jgi:predicted GIY-YIG superfamily endonuclease